VVRGFYLRFGEGVSEEANRRALALAEALLRAPPPGLLDAVPAYGVLYLEYDPRRLSRGRLLRLLKGLPQERAEEGRVVEIPVRYDGEDLPEVASRLGLSLEAVKALAYIREEAGKQFDPEVVEAFLKLMAEEA